MIRENLHPATDQSKLTKLADKGYRDAYLNSQVRSWVAYQFQALRAKFGLSQKEMAERTGKPQSVISRLENTEYGKVSVQTLLDVASSLDVALIVQFVSYPEFMERTRNKSERAMQPQTISESLVATRITEMEQIWRNSVFEKRRSATQYAKVSILDSMKQQQFGLSPSAQRRSALSQYPKEVRQ